MGDFQQRWQLADTRISINDMGATPAVVSLRLDQAVEAMVEERMSASYLEATARERILAVLDAGSFTNCCPRAARGQPAPGPAGCAGVLR
jgi:hypothetical protein